MNDRPLNQAHGWQLGQTVRIIDGPFKGMEGTIYLIDRKAQIVRVKIDFIGRPTPVELPFSYLKPVEKT